MVYSSAFHFQISEYTGNDQIRQCIFSNLPQRLGRVCADKIRLLVIGSEGRGGVDDDEIKLLLKQALTEAVNNREVFMKGIDASYAYEGYAAYKAEDL